MDVVHEDISYTGYCEDHNIGVYVKTLRGTKIFIEVIRGFKKVPIDLRKLVKWKFEINDKTRRMPRFMRFSKDIRKAIYTGIWMCQQCPGIKIDAQLGVLFRCSDRDAYNTRWTPDLWWLDRTV